MITAASFAPTAQRQVMTNEWLRPDATVIPVDYATYCSADVARDAALFLVEEIEDELDASGLRGPAAEIGTVEGLTTAPVLRDLSHRLGIELPITEGVCMVLDGKDLNALAAGLMGRQPTRE